MTSRIPEAHGDLARNSGIALEAVSHSTIPCMAADLDTDR